MTEKEKAEELIKKFYPYAVGVTTQQNYLNSIQCAIIAIEEIIKSNPQNEREYSDIPFYEEVRNELNKIL